MQELEYIRAMSAKLEFLGDLSKSGRFSYMFYYCVKSWLIEGCEREKNCALK